VTQGVTPGPLITNLGKWTRIYYPRIYCHVIASVILARIYLARSENLISPTSNYSK